MNHEEAIHELRLVAVDVEQAAVWSERARAETLPKLAHRLVVATDVLVTPTPAREALDFILMALKKDPAWESLQPSTRNQIAALSKVAR